jgi:hypothetical protein
VDRILQRSPVPGTRKDAAMVHRSGISNRETPEEEAGERAAHPPLDPGAPEPTDAAGHGEDRPLDDHRDGQTSHKAGAASVGQKMGGSRHADHAAPTTRKVGGAFGKEHGGSARDHEASSRPASREEGARRAAEDQRAHHQQTEEDADRRIDEEADESFPASDPPAHTPTSGPRPSPPEPPARAPGRGGANHDQPPARKDPGGGSTRR